LACSSLEGGGAFRAVDTGASGAPDPAVMIRPDDRPIIAATHYSGMTPSLDVLNCTTPACPATNVVTVGGPGVGLFSSVAASPAGIGLVAYYAASGQLKTAYLDGSQPADLAFTAFIPSPNPVAPGQPVNFFVQVGNLGPGIALGVQATASLPNGMSFLSSTDCSPGPSNSVFCPLADLSSGGSDQLHFQVSVAPGVPGPFTVDATVTALTSDPVPGNNSASATVNISPGLRVTSVQVVEGDVGLTEGSFHVELVDGGTNPSSVTASYTTGGGFATSGVDYVPVSGSLTFTPAAPTRTVTVSIVGDQAPEMIEDFFLQLTPQGAVVMPGAQPLLILDDDPSQAVQGGLAHGMTVVGDLAGTNPQGPMDAYVLQAEPLRSIEVVVDAISGDVQPLELRLLDWMGTLLASGTPSTLGGSVRLSCYTHETLPILNNIVTIRSGGCTTCGPDDVYRVRAYDTTARIPRFNNSGDQVTVLILQNASDVSGPGRVHFWNAQGQEVGIADFSLGPHGVAVIDTAASAPGVSGSITIRHYLPYGALQGKAVALEPSTGFSFDSPLEYRPR
ncbi:MAG TPA: Calx-beta domain-containing protein, partial [Vicinamibacteria bacterium]|nr:Calx-beta domain-containing protein [Vicinamibacteria bacterium]